MKRAIIVHGWGGKPAEGWRPWLQNALQEKGWDVTVPALPDTDHPRRDAWVRTLSECIGSPDAKTFLIGHSLGCAAILRYLEKLGKGERIGGAILVAGFAEPLGKGFEELLPFVSDNPDGDAIRSHCPSILLIASDDDPLVPLRISERLADALEAPLTLVRGGKHFRSEDGCDTFPMLLNLIGTLAGS